MRPVLSATLLLSPALLITVMLTGCAQVDPYTRNGMWQPEGVNDRNLEAMVANPADLIYGHGDPRTQPQMATTAVSQLLAGHAKTLPAISSDATPGAGGTGAATGAPAATPGAN